jgi:hypothetical protein
VVVMRQPLPGPNGLTALGALELRVHDKRADGAAAYDRYANRHETAHDRALELRQRHQRGHVHEARNDPKREREGGAEEAREREGG